jgi:hypothetical protein
MASVRREQAPPVDPGVQVPRAVREAADRATEAQRVHIGDAEPPVLPPNGSDQPPGPTPGGAPPPAAEGSPSPPPPQEAPRSDDDESWEVRYKNIRGRMEAERKRSRESVEAMAQRISQLEQQLTMNAPAPRQPAPQLNVSEQEVADYGEDFIGLVQRVAQHVVEGRVQPIEGELGRTKAQVGVQQNQTMHQKMDAIFPQWAQLNQHQPFIEWVMLPDAYSGAIRQRLMQEAWDAGDAHRVNAFFQGFLAEEAAVNPSRDVRQQAHAPAAPNGAPAPTPPLSLASLAAPGGARSASPAPADKPVYSTEDITRFYTEVAAGKWRHRDQERAAIDRDIHNAQHEGRILFNNRRFTPPAAPNGFTR